MFDKVSLSLSREKKAMDFFFLFILWALGCKVPKYITLFFMWLSHNILFSLFQFFWIILTVLGELLISLVYEIWDGTKYITGAGRWDFSKEYSMAIWHFFSFNKNWNLIKFLVNSSLSLFSLIYCMIYII